MRETRETIQVTARFDQDVIDWFRSGGRGYQARMNTVLRAHYEKQKSR
jgi:uncharacterized protein (DUF4415 family)